MPDPCNFWFSVSGNTEDVEKFYETHKILSFMTDVPYEGEYDMDWCEENWGTIGLIDWSDRSKKCEGNLRGNKIFYMGTTANCPPEVWFEKMCIKYKSLSFVWRYERTGFIGDSGWAGQLSSDGINHYVENYNYLYFKICQMGLGDVCNAVVGNAYDEEDEEFVNLITEWTYGKSRRREIVDKMRELLQKYSKEAH